MKLILVTLLLVPLWVEETTKSSSLPDNPLVERMAQINPKLELSYRRQVVRDIFVAAAKYKVSPDKLFAILAQESKFRVGAINRKTHDYGIGQVNIKNIRHYGFDQERLLTDVGYSVDKAAFMLSNFKHFAKREQNWFTRYNSSNPDKRVTYGILVARYM